jgi:hypothetical protein
VERRDLKPETLGLTLAEAEHLLDWFHVTMRLTVLKQIAKGLPEKVGDAEDQYELRPHVLNDLESLKRYLWHGNVFEALRELQGWKWTWT